MKVLEGRFRKEKGRGRETAMDPRLFEAGSALHSRQLDMYEVLPKIIMKLCDN